MGPEQAIHRSVMAMDIEGYSTRANPVQHSLRAALYALAEAAAADAGLEWSQFGVQDAGDSILLFVEPTVPPFRLAGPYLRALDDRLAERSGQVSTQYAMRLRVALHGGLVNRDAHGWYGDAVNLTARLLDAQPLREVLKTATRAHLAFIASEHLYTEVISQQYRTIDTAAYQRVRFAAKHTDGLTGWVYVPGYAAPPALAGAPREGRSAPEQRQERERSSTAESFASAMTGGVAFLNSGNVTVHGDVTDSKVVVHDNRKSGGAGAAP
jgi:hypothetical protein